MNFLIGAKGRLGTAIATSLASEQLILLERSVYMDWWQEKAVDEIALFLEKYRKIESNRAGQRCIYIASGLLDPSQSYDDHHKINFLLPKNIIEGANKVGFRTVTFGTIMEKVVGSVTSNPYILSKTKLSEFVAKADNLSYPPLHIRIHTLYGGGLPSPFMFLGQILEALNSNLTFNMSQGNQLREYHHLEDEVAAINLFIRSNMQGVVELNHGESIALKDLASYVFKRFGRLDLLNIGAASAPLKENYDQIFERPKILGSLAFRETLPSLVTYLQSCRQFNGEVECLH